MAARRLELCAFSGYKIHPGHGRYYVRVDGKPVGCLSRFALLSSLLRARSVCVRVCMCVCACVPRLRRPAPRAPPGRSVYFLGSKTESLYFQRKNPRKIAWTVLYRRKHKKGIEQENKKNRTRRTKKFTRAIEVRPRVPMGEKEGDVAGGKDAHVHDTAPVLGFFFFAGFPLPSLF